jgi:hypothetical protein
MFVPIHARRRGAADGSAQVRSKRAALVAIVGVATTTAMVSNLVQAGARHQAGGKGVAIGLAIGIGSAALGLALARAIGRQGKA